MAKKGMRRVPSPEGKVIRAALYVRVSTDRQAEEGYSVEVQTERLEAFAKTFDGEVVTELYVDDGYSGASLERPAMQRLIADAQGGAVTHVCVYKLDRLSRSQKDTLHLIEDVFLPAGVAFISVQESFNTATAFGRAVVGILSVFAQLERENIFERTRSGMQKRVEQGYWPGGGTTPFGYDYDAEKGILVPNSDAGTVRQVYELYLAGHSLQSIANLLGLKYEKLASQILKRRTNTGVIEYNGEVYPGRHEAIVSEETFERAMELYRRRSAARLVPETEHLLSGLVWCGVCGAKMRYQKWGKRGCKLVCYSHQSSKPYLVRDPNCDNAPVWAQEVEDTVVADLFALTPERIEPPEEGPASALELLTKRRQTAETKLRRLYELYAESGSELLRESIRAQTRELEEASRSLERERERGSAATIAVETKRKLMSVSGSWQFMTARERRALVCSVIDRIVVRHEVVTIHYRL